jgi:hypothetical protein
MMQVTKERNGIESNVVVCEKQNILIIGDNYIGMAIFENSKILALTDGEKEKVKLLIEKYNPVLLESVRNALTEDLFNLIIVNRDDSDFELSHLLRDRIALKRFVMHEFIKLNHNPVTAKLGEMEEVKLTLSKGSLRQKKLGL